jgi:hypothetical protein
VYSDLDLWPVTLDHGRETLWSVQSNNSVRYYLIPIYAFSENLWPGQCLKHYEQSDLDHWLITLDQDHDTFLGPGQQSCEILFKSIKRIRSYGPEKPLAYVLTNMCIVTLTIDQWPWIKVVTLPCVRCNNSVKFYSNSWAQRKSYGSDNVKKVTLTFDQSLWIKVVTLFWVQSNISVKYNSNPCFQWKHMAWTMFKPLWA